MNNVSMTPFQITSAILWLSKYNISQDDQINYAVATKFHTMIGTNFGEPTLPALSSIGSSQLNLSSFWPASSRSRDSAKHSVTEHLEFSTGCRALSPS